MEKIRKILSFIILILAVCFVILSFLIKGSDSKSLITFLVSEFKSLSSLSGTDLTSKIVLCIFYSVLIISIILSIISTIIKSFSQKGVTKKYFNTLGWMIFSILLLIWFKTYNSIFLYTLIIYSILTIVYIINMFIGLSTIELNKTVGITSSLKKFSAIKYRVMTIITLLLYIICIFIFNIGAFDITYKLKASFNVVANSSLPSLITFDKSLYSTPAMLFYFVDILSVLGYLLILTSVVIAVVGIINSILSFWYSDLTFAKADYFKKLSIKTCNNFFLGFFVIILLYELMFAKSVYGNIVAKQVFDDLLANLVVLLICLIGVIIINGETKRLDKQFNKKEEIPFSLDPNRKLTRKEKKELAKQEAKLKKETEKLAKKEEKKRAKKALEKEKIEQEELNLKIQKREEDHLAYLERLEEEKKEENQILQTNEEINTGDDEQC